MASSKIFKRNFDKYVCNSDTITAEHDGFILTATVYHDDAAEAPDKMDEGFWPSLDPKSAGYIGPKSKRTLQRHTARARAVLKAWENDEWWYCGIAVTVEKDDVLLTGKFSHALWGIDCNYPVARNRRPNTYLAEVANELAGEALDAAKEKLAALVAPVAPVAA